MAKSRTQKVVEEMVETGGKNGGSVSATMRAYGFSPAYSKNPKKFTSTKKFQELLAERVSDDLMTQTHNDLFNAGEIQHYIFPKLTDEKKVEGKGKKKKVKFQKQELTNEEIKLIVESVPGCRLIYVRRDFMGAWAFYSAPDNKSRKDAMDLAYKLKGYYAAEKVAIVDPLDELSNAELAELEKRCIEGLTNRKKQKK
jgi:hypothetical protein